jgi:outer membrane lipoprotein-sorting protein
MKRWILALLLLAPALGQRADEVLERALDALRGPPMRATAAIEVKRPNFNRRYELLIYTDGKEQSLIRVLAPPAMRGQAFLVRGGRVWIYDPRFRRVLELPPAGKSQRFLGSDFAFEDLAGRSFAEDFTPELAGEDARAYRLVLTPKPAAPTPYGKIELVVEKTTFVPIEVTYYDQRNHPVKVVRVERYAPVEGDGYLAVAARVEDLVHRGYATRFALEDFAVLKRPDPACFTLNALERGCP